MTQSYKISKKFGKITTGDLSTGSVTGTSSTFSGLVTASNGLTISSGACISSGAVAKRTVTLVAGTSAGSTAMSSTVPGLVLTGTGGITGYTVTLPASPINGQVIFISTTQAIASTFLLSGGTVSPAAPTSLTAGQSIRYIYNTSNTTWYPC